MNGITGQPVPEGQPTPREDVPLVLAISAIVLGAVLVLVALLLGLA